MVKKASGILMRPQAPEGARLPPRRLWVYRTVLDAIVDGTLAVGTRYPAARQLASEWGVARGAVDEAYELLQAEGWLQRRVGDGTYVASQLPRSVAASDQAERPLSQAAQQVLDRFAPYLGRPRQLEQPTQVLEPLPLFARAPLTEGFPLDIWRRLLARAWSDDQLGRMGYGPPTGLDELREAVARHVALTRGLRCTPQQVVIVNGPQQAIELLGRVLLEPGADVWIEDPGHTSLPALLEVLKLKPRPVPLDDQGFDAARLNPGGSTSAVYLHPLVQFPLGNVTSLQRRRRLLQWADEQDAWIIEGNFNDELALLREQPPPLQALDRSDRVVLMGTFEGIAFPSLRIAYLVMPERLVPVIAAMRGLMGDHTSMPIQQTLASFIDGGHLSARIRAMRERGQRRTQALVESVQRHVPATASLGSLDAGTHACLHLPPDLPDVEVVQALRRRGVLTMALSSMCLRPDGRNALVLGHASFDEATIARAVAEIGTVLRVQRARAYQPAGDSR